MALRRALDALYWCSAALAALSLFGIFVIMIAQMVLRQFNIPLMGADDVTAFLCVASAFFALAYTFRRGELIRVGLFIEKLSPQARQWTEGGVLLLAAVLTGYITYWCLNDVLFSYEIDDMAQGSVAFKLWIPKLAMPLGAGILLIAIIDEFVRVARGLKPSYQVAAEDRAARGDFSAEV
ncbi:TRAP transporter small permease [Rhodovarius crocodyli]|uniref:TRAP transporter small permease protein n=1 Tax=Rhodovarius crocodyli TaxID=1979269 RepID=A0A437MP12_9PROT|nr:TRAP transporter small permease [Rhodovarius crocodyli]RVT99379.1 TRAP transporter small permease [Rhodovarius crocodyli]